MGGGVRPVRYRSGGGAARGRADGAAFHPIIRLTDVRSVRGGWGGWDQWDRRLPERAGWRYGSSHLHRAPAGRDLRHPPHRRQGHRRPGLRRLLPFRPLSEDGERGRPPRPHRRLDHPGRPRPRDQAHPPRHADDRRHLPSARCPCPSGRPGRPDVRRPGRAGPRGRLVRGGAPGLRHSVPEGEVRPPRGAAGDRHRAVADRGRQDFGFHGTYYDLTDSPALPKPAQAKVPVLIGGHGATAPRGWRRSTPTSSTSRSPRSRTASVSSAGSVPPPPRPAGPPTA